MNLLNFTLFFSLKNNYSIELNYFLKCGSLLINGGAISFSISDSTLLVTKSIFENCNGKNGGGIYFLNNILIIYQCCFINLISQENGAAIFTDKNNLKQLINQSIILKCNPTGYYGICLNDGIINLNTNNFSYNNARYGSAFRISSHNPINSIQYCQISHCIGGYIIGFVDNSNSFEQYSHSTNFINISITIEAIIVVHYGKKIVENFLIISKVPIGFVSNNGKLYFKNSFTTSNNLLNAININSSINLNDLKTLNFTFKINCLFNIKTINNFKFNNNIIFKLINFLII